METSIPIEKLGLRKAVEDINPEIEKAEDEDTIIARLANYPEWKALKGRIERKMKALELKIDSGSVAEIDDMAVFGFKCMSSQLVQEALQGVINDVEVTNQVLKAKDNGKDK